MTPTNKPLTPKELERLHRNIADMNNQQQEFQEWVVPISFLFTLAILFIGAMFLVALFNVTP